MLSTLDTFKNYILMIKGNELNVRNIDFELYAERGDKFLCFTLFRNINYCR